MRRRHLLEAIGAAAVAGLSGCLTRGRGSQSPDAAADGDPSSATTPETVPIDDDPTSTPTDPGPRQVTLARVDDGSLRSVADVAASVTVADSTVTPEGTAHVAVTVTNRSDEPRTLAYDHVECDLNLLRGSQRNGSAGLLLVTAQWTAPDGGCWRADERNVDCGIPVVEHEVTLDGGEDLTWEFTLWGPPKNRYEGGCMPPGEYEFVRPFRLGDRAARLSFDLTLTIPHDS